MFTQDIIVVTKNSKFILQLVSNWQSLTSFIHFIISKWRNNHNKMDIDAPIPCISLTTICSIEIVNFK